MLKYDSDNKNWKIRQYKIRFFLIVERVLAFVSSPNMVKKVKTLFSNSKQIVFDVLHYWILSFGKVDPFYR